MGTVCRPCPAELYASGEGGDPEEHVEMEKAGYGTWRIHIDRDLKGSFYTFQIEKTEMVERNTRYLAKPSVSMGTGPL